MNPDTAVDTTALCMPLHSCYVHMMKNTWNLIWLLDWNALNRISNNICMRFGLGLIFNKINHMIYWLFDQINHNYKQIIIFVLDYICIYLDTVFVTDLSQN